MIEKKLMASFSIKTLASEIESAQVSDILKELFSRGNAPVISIDERESLSAALETLAKNRILSCLVHSAADSEHGKKHYVGFIDALDLVAVGLSLIETDVNIGQAQTDESERKTLRVWASGVQGEQLWQKGLSECTVGSVVDARGRNPLRRVPLSQRLSELISRMAVGVHRVAAVNSDRDEIVGIVSQSDVLRFIARRTNLLTREHAGASLEQLGLLGEQRRPLVSIDWQRKALYAFHEMRANNVSAVAVVDGAGALVGSLSASDLRGLSVHNAFDALQLSAADFLQRHIDASRLPPHSVTPSTTFEVLLLKFGATGAHRLWIVDSTNKAIGVISLTDALPLYSFIDIRLQSDETKY
jgi:CBS domain-containing protein